MKKTLALIWVLLTFCNIYADDVSVEQARQIAAQFANSQSGRRKIKIADHNIAQQVQTAYTMCSEGQTADLYVFNIGQDDGFVIVSGNDGTKDAVLGYSFNGSFDYDKAPGSAKFMLDNYAQQIKAVRADKSTKHRIKAQASGIGAGTIVVDPFLNVSWSQEYPYNLMLDSLMRYTGCVITAVAQIMRYYEWPKRGRGSHTNEIALLPENAEQLHKDHRDDELLALTKYSSVYVDFSSSVYDWGHMKRSYKDGCTEQEANAVAKLMLDINTAFNANPDPGNTGTSTNLHPSALAQYFSYKPNMQTGASVDTMKYELRAKHPIYITGGPKDKYAPNDGFHAFVCDGYDDKDYFHLNFGWEGYCDGFYKLDDIILPNRYDYSYITQIVIGIVPNTETTEEDGVMYDAINENEATVVGCKESEDFEAVIKESVTINGKPHKVTEIAPNAFSQTYLSKAVSIQGITIPSSIKRIRDNAFADSHFQKINIHSLSAFMNLEFENPDNSESSFFTISRHPDLYLNGEKVETLVIPEGTKKIGESFRRCHSITGVEIPAGVDSIAPYAFSDCKNITKVTWSGIKHIGKCAFQSCKNLSEISSINHMKRIEAGVFNGCPLTEISLEGEIVEIGEGAFSGHKASKIYIPAKVTSIGQGALYGRNLVDITVSPSNPFHSSYMGALYDKERKILYEMPQAQIINGTTPSPKKNCTIGVPATVTSIRSYFPDGTTAIIIPESVEDIGEGCFSGCENLYDVYVYSATPILISDRTFPSGRQYLKIHVPEGSKEAYESATGWRDLQIVDDLPAGSKPEPGYDWSSDVITGLRVRHNVYELSDVLCKFDWMPAITFGDEEFTEIVDEQDYEDYADIEGFDGTYKYKEYALHLSSKYLDIVIAMRNVKGLDFLDVRSYDSIKEIEKTDISSAKAKPTMNCHFTNDAVEIEGLKKAEKVSLYKMNGQEILSVKASAEGTAKITLPAGDAETYILKAGKQSIKIHKK